MSGNPPLQVPPLQWSLGGMFFDSWLNLHHNSSLTITSHPVETGASKNDHAFVNARRFSFDILMTDTVELPRFPGAANRSVNAFNKLDSLHRSRAPLTLVSKYGVYENVLIESLDAVDNFQTQSSGQFRINVQEVITVNTRTTKRSLNPQATDETNRGQIAPQPVRQDYAEAAKKALGGLWNTITGN